MNLKECEENLSRQLREATIVLLLKDDEVLLAMKKRGFGVGKWNGVGGKLNPGETIRETALRETEEEITVIPEGIEEMAIMNYFFPSVTADNVSGQKVYVYIARKWSGEPTETEEMQPKWFKLSEIPYSEMWCDDIVWMPKVLNGEYVKGSFLFGDNDEIVEYSLEK
jgi:mutator protein MutT